MDSDQSDDEARAFAVPDGPPDFSIKSFDDVSAEEFLRRVAHEARRLPKVSVATNLDARRFDASRTPQLPPQIASKLRGVRGGQGGGDGCGVANASRAQSATDATHSAFPVCFDAANGRADETSETWAADFTAGFVDLRQAVVRHSLLHRQRRGVGLTHSDVHEAAHHGTAAAFAVSASTATAPPRHSTPALPKSLSARDWRDFCLGRVARQHSALGEDATASAETQQRRRGDVSEKICDDDGDDDGNADGNADPDTDAAATGDVGDADDDGGSDQEVCNLSLDAAAAAMSVPAHSPLLSILVRMDAVAIDTALNALIAYLIDASPTDEALEAMTMDVSSLPANNSALSVASECTDSAKADTVEIQRHASSRAHPSPSPSATRPQCPLTAHLAAWLYALLATIDKPLLADTAAALRALHRRCARLLSVFGHVHGDASSCETAATASSARAAAVPAAVLGGDADSRMATTARLGLLMTIVDRCFQQRS